LTIANGIGRLTGISDQVGTGAYSFDPMGRIAAEQRSIAGFTKNMSYLYYLDGSVKKMTYPSGATLTYTPSAAARMLSAVDSGNGINYATGATYASTGALAGLINGNSGGFAGITNSLSYNKRLQPIFMSASTPTHTVFSIGYDFHLGNSDNGNVYQLTNNRDTTRNQTFTYDQLNRLISAQNAGTGNPANDCNVILPDTNSEFWGNSYSFDAWGNLLTKNITKCASEFLSVVAQPNNQLVGFGYDAAGNMTSATGQQAASIFDAENRMTTANFGGATTNYTYDGDGNRVEKSNGTTGTLYWYMMPGIVAESDLNGNLQSEYIFFDGTRIARKDFPSNAVSYYFSDHLKTTDIVTDANGNILNESDYYPWGGELQFLANDSNHYKFTGKEHDNETGLDYFGARYYSNQLGRFITPDWSATLVPVPYADLTDPQTLNQYSYVRNIPTTRFDADGHQDGCGYFCHIWNDFKAITRADGYDEKQQAANQLKNDLLGNERPVLPNQGAINSNDTPSGPPIPSGLINNLPTGSDGEKPDRTSSDPLRRDANGKAIPDPEAQGAAHSQLGTKTSQSQAGNPQYKQALEYDENGNPVRRIDFTDHGRSDHPDPHQHVIDPNTGKIGPTQPLPPPPPPPPPPKKEKPD